MAQRFSVSRRWCASRVPSTGGRPSAVGLADRHRGVGRAESNLVGRRLGNGRREGLLDRAIDGHGAVVGVVGPPGIGKSRLVREFSAMAAARGVEVFTTFCESHTSQIPSTPSRGCCGRRPGSGSRRRRPPATRVRGQVPDTDPEDLLLLDDLLGIADPDVTLPRIDPDARRRRLTALMNAASLARTNPAVYVIEDAHWIDEVSESMMADFLTVIPQTPSLVLSPTVPSIDGALTRVHGAQTIALAPLSDPETASLVSRVARAGPLCRRAGPRRSPRGPPVTRSSPRRSCASWPSAVCCDGEPGAYVSRRRLLR